MERADDNLQATATATQASSRRAVTIEAFAHGVFERRDDTLAVERALEIHVAGADPLVTMRTPGADRELVAGLMHSEGVIQSRDDIVYLKPAPGEADVMRLMLKPAARERLGRIERNTLMSSACGVCGKPSFTAPRPQPDGPATTAAPALAAETLLSLPARLRADQGVFDATGGLHAAGLFDAAGRLVASREDIGRHNALDKLVGWALFENRLPLSDHILMLSGRASYELLQKSVMAGLPVVCAISAPSSFAVDLATRFDITLVGFLRSNRFNVYAGGQRMRSVDSGD